MTLNTSGVLTTFTPPICATAPTTAYNNNYTSPIVSVSGSNAFFDNTCV